MLILLKTSLASTAKSFAQGDIVEWDDADAGRLIAAGLAEFAEPAAPEEIVLQTTKPKTKKTKE